MLFFFYGTVMEPDIFHLVLGQRREAIQARPAALPGFRRARARDGDYPVLVRRSDGQVAGHLVAGLDARALLPIAYFEGPDYLPRKLRAVDRAGQRHSAWVFLPRRPGTGISPIGGSAASPACCPCCAARCKSRARSRWNRRRCRGTSGGTSFRPKSRKASSGRP